MSVLVLGDSEALALAGVPEPAEPRLVVALDDAVVPVGLDVPVVRWWRAACAETGSAGERVIAPAGDGLWSRAVWPVSDEVLALAAAPLPGAVLLVEPDRGVREEGLGELLSRGLAATATDRLTVDALAAADVVIHGVGVQRPLPGDAVAVLGAGRLLVTNAEPAFGLRRGIDHLAAEGISPAADLAEAAMEFPAAFAAVRRFGRHAAGRRWAPDVYASLLFDAT
jgi:hypothetical protein